MHALVIVDNISIPEWNGRKYTPGLYYDIVFTWNLH